MHAEQTTILHIFVALLAVTSPAWMLYLAVKWENYADKRRKEKDAQTRTKLSDPHTAKIG